MLIIYRDATGANPPAPSMQTSEASTSKETPRTSPAEETNATSTSEPGYLDRIWSRLAQYLGSITLEIDGDGISIGFRNSGNVQSGMPPFGPARDETGSLIGGGAGFTDPNSAVDYFRLLNPPSGFDFRAKHRGLLGVPGTPGFAEFNASLLRKLHQRGGDVAELPEPANVEPQSKSSEVPRHTESGMDNDLDTYSDAGSFTTKEDEVTKSFAEWLLAMIHQQLGEISSGDVRAILPEMLQEFAIRLGHEGKTRDHRKLMYVAHKPAAYRYGLFSPWLLFINSLTIYPGPLPNC